MTYDKGLGFKDSRIYDVSFTSVGPKPLQLKSGYSLS